MTSGSGAPPPQSPPEWTGAWAAVGLARLGLHLGSLISAGSLGDCVPLLHDPVGGYCGRLRGTQVFGGEFRTCAPPKLVCPPMNQLQPGHRGHQPARSVLTLLALLALPSAQAALPAPSSPAPARRPWSGKSPLSSRPSFTHFLHNLPTLVVSALTAARGGYEKEGGLPGREQESCQGPAGFSGES